MDQVWEVFRKGGVMMYPIALCSVLALAIMIERWWVFFRARTDVEQFMFKINRLLKNRKVVEAVALCDETSGPVSYIVKAGVLNHDRSREEVSESIENAGLHILPTFERYLGLLGTIAQISPLMGLLGTVTGMIKAFRTIERLGGTVKPSHLAGGIWEALITTAAGLAVAIPALVAYNYFSSRVDRLSLEMEASSNELVDVLKPRRQDRG